MADSGAGRAAEPAAEPAPSGSQPLVVEIVELAEQIDRRDAQAGYEAALSAADRAALPSLSDFLR